MKTRQRVNNNVDNVCKIGISICVVVWQKSRKQTKLIKTIYYILKIQKRQRKRKKKSIWNHDDCAIFYTNKKSFSLEKGRLKWSRHKREHSGFTLHILICVYIYYGNVSSCNQPTNRRPTNRTTNQPCFFYTCIDLIFTFVTLISAPLTSIKL